VRLPAYVEGPFVSVHGEGREGGEEEREEGEGDVHFCDARVRVCRTGVGFVGVGSAWRMFRGLVFGGLLYTVIFFWNGSWRLRFQERKKHCLYRKSEP
jgi:hypothetical protein